MKLCFILSSVIIAIGDLWNVIFDVGNRTYTISYHIEDGRKVFYYSSKVFCDFIGPAGFSIGDVLIYSGLIMFAITLIFYGRRVLKKYRVSRKFTLNLWS
jgi:hypothetical protein